MARSIQMWQFPLQGAVVEHAATSHSDSIVELGDEMSCGLAILCRESSAQPSEHYCRGAEDAE